MNNEKLPADLIIHASKHCHKCGSALVFRGKEIEQYDEETGEPEYIYVFTCPKKSFWNPFDFHANKGYLVCAEKDVFGGGKRRTVLERFG